MRKFLAYFLTLVLITTSLTACVGDVEISFDEDSYIAALQYTAAKLLTSNKNATNQGGTSILNEALTKRFQRYEEELSKLANQGSDNTIMTQEQLKSRRDFAASQKTYLTKVLAESNADGLLERKDVLNGTVWILSPKLLLDIYNYCKALYTYHGAKKKFDVVLETDDPENNISGRDLVASTFLISFGSEWNDASTLYTDTFNKDNYLETTIGDPVLQSLISDYSSSSKMDAVNQLAADIRSLFVEKYNGDKNTLNYYLTNELKIKDIFGDLEATDPNYCYDTLSSHLSKNFKVETLTFHKSTSSKSDTWSSEQDIDTALRWTDDDYKKIKKAAQGRRFAILTKKCYTWTKTEGKGDGTSATETVNYCSIEADLHIAPMAVMSKKINVDNQDYNLNQRFDNGSYGYGILQPIIAEIEANHRVLSDKNIDKIKQNKSLLGMNTVEPSISDEGSKNQNITREVYTVNFSGVDSGNIVNFREAIKNYNDASQNKKGEAGDAVFPYLTYLDEDVQYGDLMKFYQSSTAPSNLDKYTKADNLIKNVMNAQVLDINNGAVGTDLIINYKNLPLYSIRLLEIKRGASDNVSLADLQKIAEGYKSIQLKKERGGTSILFKNLVLVQVIDKMNSEGFTMKTIPIYFDIENNLFYYTKDTMTLPQDPYWDKLDAEGERDKIFNDEQNQLRPYDTTMKGLAFLPSPKGAVCLGEYQTLHYNSASNTWYPLGRRIFINTNNLDFTSIIDDSNGGPIEYKWKDKSRPVAYFSDPATNTAPSTSRAFAVYLSDICDADRNVVDTTVTRNNSGGGQGQLRPNPLSPFDDASPGIIEMPTLITQTQ